MSETPNAHGSVLGNRYRLEDLLTEAPGGRFWRATDQVLARDVAVHVIDADDPRADTLLEAARTSAAVTDARILRVLDAARADGPDGVVYVVNEWGSGMSLDRMLAEGTLSPRRAAWVVKEVAEAIVDAHRHGIAHGRLIPENVMVTEAGSVKLIGFVIDSVIHHGHPTDASANEDEQDRDVVDLGALLYAALAGRWAGTPGSAVPAAPRDHGHLLRPRQVRAGVPRALDLICDRVLNAGPQAAAPGLHSAHEICAALSDYIGDPTGASRIDVAPTVLDPEATQATAPPVSAEPQATEAMHPDLGRPDERRRSPAPPPPLPDPEPRPLFAPERQDGAGAPSRRAWADPAAADDTRTRAVPASHRTSGGTGSLPPVWGPDAAADTAPPREVADSGKSWLKLAAIIAVCLALLVALVVAVKLGQGSGSEPEGQPSGSPATEKVGPISISAVSDFDPEGDPPEENPDEVPRATDGDPTTAWGTLTYRGNPKLGLLKSGVGLLVDLGSAQQVSAVHLTLLGEPTSLEVLAAPEGAGKPTSVDGLTKLGTVTDAGTDVVVKADQPVTTRYLVIWLTSLPPYPGGYKGRIAEITVRG